MDYISVAVFKTQSSAILNRGPRELADCVEIEKGKYRRGIDLCDVHQLIQPDSQSAGLLSSILIARRLIRV